MADLSILSHSVEMGCLPYSGRESIVGATWEAVMAAAREAATPSRAALVCLFCLQLLSESFWISIML